jgi:hypothetical protein
LLSSWHAVTEQRNIVVNVRLCFRTKTIQTVSVELAACRTSLQIRRQQVSAKRSQMYDKAQRVTSRKK